VLIEISKQNARRCIARRIGINFALSQLAGKIIQGAMADNAAIEAAMAAAKARNEAAKEDIEPNSQANPDAQGSHGSLSTELDAQAHVDPNTQGSDVDAQADVDPDAPNARVVRDLDTCLMDLLNRLDMKFGIGRKIASSRSGGRLHALASQTTDGGKQLRVEIDVHFGSSV